MINKKYIALFIFLVMAFVSGCEYNNSNNITKNTSTGSSMSSDISTIQAEKLQFIIQEEKLARDIYTKLYEKRGIKKFGNILNSEENHQELVKIILDKYNISNPILDKGIGEFENKELSNLYKELLARGYMSQEEAIKVGITIEEKDIYDIKEMMNDYQQNQDIIDTLQKLLDGSYRHLQAFNK